MRLPAQHFTAGSYALVVSGRWPELWAALGYTVRKLEAAVAVGQRTVDEVTVAAKVTAWVRIENPGPVTVVLVLTGLTVCNVEFETELKKLSPL